MKKLILLIIFLPFLQANAQTSVYHPFPDSNAVWNFHASIYCMFVGTETDNFYSITIIGDTSINGQTYRMLHIPYVNVVTTGLCSGNFVYPGYKGGIREDALNRKVYIVPPGDTTEQLLYDFNLQIGDTVIGFIATYSSIPDIVIDIDSILVGNNFRKRWLINPYYNIYLIEGIGSTYGFIEQSPGNIADYWDNDLICFKQNNQTLYPDTTTTCELITVSVPDVGNELQEFKIFPNPALDELNISFKLQELSEVKFQLFNSLGHVVKEIAKQKLNAGENKITFSIENVPEGVYFLRIKIDENEIVKKVVKF